MEKEIKKTETLKTKQFSVIVERKEVLNTSKSKDAVAKINELQLEHQPTIILIDHKEKKSTHYTKKKA